MNTHCLYDSPSFIVTCDEATPGRPLVIMVVNKATNLASSFSGELLKGFTALVNRWQLVVPEQAEVEEALDALSVGGTPLEVH